MRAFSSSGFHLILLGLLLLGARGSVHAGVSQQAPVVQLTTGSVQLGSPTESGGQIGGVSIRSAAVDDGSDSSGAPAQQGVDLDNNSQYLFAFTPGKQQDALHAALLARGAFIVSYIPDNTWRVACRPSVARKVAQMTGALMAEYGEQHRVSPDWSGILGAVQQRAAAARRRALLGAADDEGGAADAEGPASGQPALSEVVTWAPGASAGGEVAAAADGSGSSSPMTPPRYSILIDLLPTVRRPAARAAAEQWPALLAASLGLPAAGAAAGSSAAPTAAADLPPCWPIVALQQRDTDVAALVDADAAEAGTRHLLAFVCEEHLPAAVSWLSGQPLVAWVAPKLVKRLNNAQESILMQTGTLLKAQAQNISAASRPFWMAGIDGSGEVVGLGDTGTNLGSCYFADSRVATSQYTRLLSAASPRRFVLPWHRKVLQYYVAPANRGMPPSLFGDEDGHGTHTAGSVAGAILQDPSNAAGSPFVPDTAVGAAPRARLSLCDFGGAYTVQGQYKDFIDPPEPYSTAYLPVHTSVGANVISDSWGSKSNLYDGDARQFDVFLWRNPDAISFVSAGNNGSFAGVPGGTIGSPATAKSVVAVGAVFGFPTDAPGARGVLQALGVDAEGKPNFDVGAYPFESMDTPSLVSALGINGTAYPVALAQPYLGCAPLTNAAEVAGKVVFVQRGDCYFFSKAVNAQKAGALAMVIVNNGAEDLTPDVTDPVTKNATVKIPVSSLPMVLGNWIVGNITSGAVKSMTVRVKSEPISVGDVVDFSAYGVLLDGRIKPDLVAPGVNVVSASYQGTAADGETCARGTLAMSGTSMATPLSAGHAALARQYLRAGFYPTGSSADAASAPFTPSGMLLKALLVAGAVSLKGGVATQLGTTRLGDGPDGYQGFGRLSLAGSLPLGNMVPGLQLQLLDRGTVRQGDKLTFSGLTIAGSGPGSPAGPAGSALPLVVVLAWYDYPADVNAGKALVNDLDLEVWVGNVPFYGNVPAGSVGRDNTNVVERVKLPPGALVPGAPVTIIVRGSNIASAYMSGADAKLPQRFAVAVLGPISGTLQSPLNPAYEPLPGPPPVAPPPPSGSGANGSIAPTRHSPAAPRPSPPKQRLPPPPVGGRRKKKKAAAALRAPSGRRH